jgi:hypothetical protein
MAAIKEVSPLRSSASVRSCSADPKVPNERTVPPQSRGDFFINDVFS